MISNSLYEKISFFLSILILNNYLLIALNFSSFFLKINLLLFFLTVGIFYFKDISKNIYLKIFIFFLAIICLGTPISEWDPRSTWFFHAKRIFYDQTIYSVADNYAKFSHNDYPTLAPAFASSLANLVGYWNEIFPKLSFFLMFLPPIILVSAIIKDTKYLIFLSLVLFTMGRFLFNGWADGLVAIYFGTSALLIYLLILSNNLLNQNKIILYLISISFFITLTLIKSEGLALLLVLFITAFILTLIMREFKKKIIRISILSISFIPILLWKYFCYSNDIGGHYIFEANFLSNFLLRLNDLENFKLISYFLLLNEKFLLTLFFFIFSIWITKNKNILNFVCISCLIYIFILYFVYLSTPLDFYFQLESSAARVIRSLSFLLALFGLYNLSIYKINKL